MTLNPKLSVHLMHIGNSNTHAAFLFYNIKILTNSFIYVIIKLCFECSQILKGVFRYDFKNNIEIKNFQYVYFDSSHLGERFSLGSPRNKRRYFQTGNGYIFFSQKNYEFRDLSNLKIETERLTITPTTEEDLDTLSEYLLDKDVSRYLENGAELEFATKLSN